MYEKVSVRSSYNTLYDLYGFKATDEPTAENTPEIGHLVEYLAEQLDRRRFSNDFEPSLLQAIADYPQLPEFRNYYIVYLGLRGRLEEVEKASHDLIRDFPDYLFGRTGLAQLLIQTNKITEAEALLGWPRTIETLTGKRDTYHESELHAYYSAATAVALALEDIDAAREHLPVLILTRPDHETTLQLAHKYALLQDRLRDEYEAHDEEYEREVESFPTKVYEPADEPPSLHHAELSIFYTTAIEEIEAETMTAIGGLPRETLRADLEAILIDSIRRQDYFWTADLDENEYDAPLHAFYWLGTLEMEESLPIILDWLRQGDDFLDFWLFDSVIDLLFDSFYPIAKNKLPDLLTYIKEPNQSSEARILVATVAAKVALEEEGRRTEAVNWFREVTRYLVTNIEDDSLIDTGFVESLVFSIKDFQGTELWPEIEALYAHHLIPISELGNLSQIKKSLFTPTHQSDTIGNYSLSVVQSYGKENAQATNERIRNIDLDNIKPDKSSIIHQYRPILHNHLNNHITPIKPAPKPKPMLKPVFAPQYKAPQNAPCPCGSGKKFKRCHGA
jgi:SEC-C motif